MTEEPTASAPSAESPMTDEPARPRRSLGPTLVVAGITLLADQLTKHWAVNRLADDRMIHVVWTLRFNLTFNSGMSFSRGEGLGPVIGIIALVVVVVLLLSLRREGSRLGDIGAGLVIGGALGNVADRVFRGEGWLNGAVVDFIDFQWWPIFNIADIGVTVGGTLLLVGSVLGSGPERAAARAASRPGANRPAGPAA
jgi:signal peptidase II